MVSQAASAESNVSIAAIQKIESGETNPSLLTVLVIADALGESVDRLIAASRKASQLTHVVRGTLQQGTLGSTALSALKPLSVRSRLINLGARSSLKDVPKNGALFAYVLAGSLQLRFVDGAVEQLGMGDLIHVKDDLPIAWENPLPKASVTLCVIDKRPDSLVP